MVAGAKGDGAWSSDCNQDASSEGFFSFPLEDIGLFCSAGWGLSGGYWLLLFAVLSGNILRYCVLYYPFKLSLSQLMGLFSMVHLLPIVRVSVVKPGQHLFVDIVLWGLCFVVVLSHCGFSLLVG